MELKTAHVKNFRSVEDSGLFSVEHLTCLVGKNEAGKTAILQAIAGLNPHPATPFSYELERDYPKRYLARYKERHGDEEAEIIRTTWELDDKEIAALKAELGPNSVTGRTVTASTTKAGTSWSLPIDEAEVIKYHMSVSGFSAPEKAKLGSQPPLRR